jgi:hypothetical protein
MPRRGRRDHVRALEASAFLTVALTITGDEILAFRTSDEADEPLRADVWTRAAAAVATGGAQYGDRDDESG